MCFQVFFWEEAEVKLTSGRHCRMFAEDWEKYSGLKQPEDETTWLAEVWGS